VKAGNDMNFNQSTKTQETNQMYTTKVNVNDLVIDMPLDEANVQQKMESLKNGGLVQPVTVWLNDFRIIDGFHRTEAAKRLGWTDVDCVVKDCDDETFWDARIQSARQHHTITGQRLISWISEVWEKTEWAIEGDSSKSALKSIAEAIWNIKKQCAGGYENPDQIAKLPPLEQSIFQWMASKAQLWNMKFIDLQVIIFDSYETKIERKAVPFLEGAARKFDEIAGQADLSLEQRLSVAQILPEGGWRNEVDYFTEFARAYPIPDFSNATDGDIQSARNALFDFAKQRKDEERKKQSEIDIRKYQEERRRKQQEQEQQSRQREEWLNSAQGQKHLQDELRQAIADATRQLKVNIKLHRDTFIKLDDGYEILIGLSAYSANKAAELWPDRKQPTEVELKQELASAYRRIESLERALDSKGRHVPRFPDVYAWSSTDVAKAAHGE
jgi:hypothetical protein